MFAESSGAVPVAALASPRTRGVIEPGSRVVCLIRSIRRKLRARNDAGTGLVRETSGKAPVFFRGKGDRCAGAMP